MGPSQAVARRRVLEFGCNVGASAIVLAWLGARVQAVDIAKSMVDLAEANARRYGETSGDGIAIGEGRAAFAHVADSRALPFPDACFDLVTCNSVLEYVHPDQLRAIQQEIDRVVAPGGLILVTGTSSRLWPREAHSGRWFIHWLPRRVGPLLGRGRNIEYGVWPWMVRYGFGPDYDNLDASDKAAAYLAARAAMRPPRTGAGYRLLAAAARLLGVGPGLLGNSIFCLLLKRG